MSDKKLTMEEFNNMPVVGPSVNAFLDLLAGIAARELGSNKTEENEKTENDEKDEEKKNTLKFK